jgi:hypothetical protein
MKKVAVEKTTALVFDKNNRLLRVRRFNNRGQALQWAIEFEEKEKRIQEEAHAEPIL